MMVVKLVGVMVVEKAVHWVERTVGLMVVWMAV